MREKDVKAQLRVLNLRIAWGTIGRWAREGLVSAQTGSRKYPRWPDTTAAEAAAAYWLIRELGLRASDVRDVRLLFAPLIRPQESKALGLVKMLDMLYEEDPPLFYPVAVEWVIAFGKAMANLPLHKPAVLRVRPGDAGVEFVPVARSEVAFAVNLHPRELSPILVGRLFRWWPQRLAASSDKLIVRAEDWEAAQRVRRKAKDRKRKK